MAVTGKTFDNQQPKRRAAFISWRRLSIVLVLGVVLVGAILIRAMSRGSDVDRGTRALVEATRRQRLIEPRLSGGLSGGAYDAARGDSSEPRTKEFKTAQDHITDAVANGEAGAEMAYGRLLLLSKSEKLPEARKYLHRVVVRSPESAEARNELGVCCIQEGKLEDAINEFEAALKNRPEMPEAIFNRALCYQKLLLKTAAAAGFTRLLSIEHDKAWLEEINQRLETVSSRLAQQSLDPAAAFDAAVVEGQIDKARALADQDPEALSRHAVWDLSIRQLKAAVDGNNQEASQALSGMELIGSVLIETRSNSLIADLAGYIRNLPETERRPELDLIKRYVETFGVFQSSQAADALMTFNQLRQQFQDRRNYVFEALSAFQAANYYYSVKRFAESITLLKETLSKVEPRKWPYNRACILNLLALQTSRLGQDSLAIKYFDQAISFCTNSPQLESQILQYMSIPYLRLGDLDTALARLRDSTRHYLENGQQPRLFANLAHNYWEIADIYRLRNLHALSLLYAREALGYSGQAKDLNYAAEYSSFIAIEHARLNQFEEAEAELKRALEALDGVAAGRPRDFTEARVLTNAGEVAVRSGDVPRALDYYERARTLAAKDEGSALPTIDVLRGRAEAYAASGQSDKAYSDLMNAVNLIEKYRANIAASTQRSHFLDASHNVFDQLIALEGADRVRPAERFEMSERARARALLEEIGRGNNADTPPNVAGSARTDAITGQSSELVRPLNLDEVQSNLDDDLIVLEYSVTDKGTFLFLITRSDFKIVKSPATTEILDQLVPAYISDLRRIAPLEELNEKARALYDYLIEPVRGEISKKTNVCIVPDKALHFLPFAGLVDSSNNYLIDSQPLTLTYAPSASVLVKCIKEERAPKSAGDEKILAVGNPRLSSEYSANLSPLVDAEDEARKSAQFYAPGSEVLIDDQATEPRVRAAIANCDVAHLALHCLVEESSPWLAALVLAGAGPVDPSRPGYGSAPRDSSANTNTRAGALPNVAPYEPKVDTNDGLLYLNELYNIRLPHVRLVVLSACQSGLGQYYRGEGIVSLVRPLLAAGVPTVVASLWPVNSQATSDLMIDFHRQRKLAKKGAGDALHSAQLQMRQSDHFSHPFYWAPFIVVGAKN